MTQGEEEKRRRSFARRVTGKAHPNQKMMKKKNISVYIMKAEEEDEDCVSGVRIRNNFVRCHKLLLNQSPVRWIYYILQGWLVVSTNRTTCGVITDKIHRPFLSPFNAKDIVGI